MKQNNTLIKDWNDFWVSKYRMIEDEMRMNFESHQGKITFDLFSEYKKGDAILEAGCGLGNWAFIFSKMQFKPVGLDISLSSLQIADEYNREKSLGVNFILGDLRQTPIRDNQFDIVVSYGVIEHFANSQDALKEFCRVLRPGGACLVTTPNPFSFHRIIGRHILNVTKSRKLGYVGYEKAFTPRKLEKLLREAGFTRIKYGILSEGMGHLFGNFWPAIPFIGKNICKILIKLSSIIERKQNCVGGGSFAIGYKNNNL